MNIIYIKVKCLITCIVICIGESVIHKLKLNILTALFILLLLPHEFILLLLLLLLLQNLYSAQIQAGAAVAW